MAEQLLYKLPLVFEPQPEGGYTVTCPILPELITEGDTIAEALDNVSDALLAIIEAYEDLGRPLPPVLRQAAFDRQTPFWMEAAVVAWDTEVARKLQALGCEELPRRTGGSHHKWHNPATGQIAPVPDWSRKDLKMGTLRHIVRQLGLDWEAFKQV